MPVLGIVASSISGNLYSASYESIATFNPSGVASVTFTSIPQTYTHLQLRIFGRGAVANTYSYLKIRFNGVSGTSYNFHGLLADGFTASSFGYTGQSYVEGNFLAGDSTSANVQGSIVMDILDYTNTNKYKTTRSIGCIDNLGSNGRIALSSSSFFNTAAISQILVATPGGENFNSGTSIALYGIKE